VAGHAVPTNSVPRSRVEPLSPAAPSILNPQRRSNSDLAQYSHTPIDVASISSTVVIVLSRRDSRTQPDYARPSSRIPGTTADRQGGSFLARSPGLKPRAESGSLFGTKTSVIPVRKIEATPNTPSLRAGGFEDDDKDEVSANSPRTGYRSRARKYTPRFTTTKIKAYPPVSQVSTLLNAASADSLTSLAGTLTICAPMMSLSFQPKPLFFP
jgi:hypothetical protein